MEDLDFVTPVERRPTIMPSRRRVFTSERTPEERSWASLSLSRTNARRHVLERRKECIVARHGEVSLMVRNKEIATVARTPYSENGHAGAVARSATCGRKERLPRRFPRREAVPPRRSGKRPISLDAHEQHYQPSARQTITLLHGSRVLREQSLGKRSVFEKAPRPIS